MLSLYVLFILLSYIFNIIKLIKSYNNRVLNVGLIREKWFEYKSSSKFDLILNIVVVIGLISFYTFAVSNSKNIPQDTSTVWGWYQGLENPRTIYSVQFVVVIIMLILCFFLEIKQMIANNIISIEGILSVDGEFIPWNRVEEVEEGSSSDKAINKVIKVKVKAKKRKDKTWTIKLIVPKHELKDALSSMRNAVNINRDE